MRVRGEHVSFGIGEKCIVCGGRGCSQAPTITPHARYPFYPEHTRNKGRVPMASQEYFVTENRVFVNGSLLYGPGRRVTKETADALGLTDGHGELRLQVNEDGEVTDREERGLRESSEEGGYSLTHATEGADDGQRPTVGREADPATGTPNVPPSERDNTISSASLQGEEEEKTEPPPKNASKEVWADFVGYDGDLNDITRDELIEQYEDGRNVLT